MPIANNRRKFVSIHKFCKACGKKLIRKRYYDNKLEGIAAFKKRLYCNKECASAQKPSNNLSSQSASDTSVAEINPLVNSLTEKPST